MKEEGSVHFVSSSPELEFRVQGKILSLTLLAASSTEFTMVCLQLAFIC